MRAFRPKYAPTIDDAYEHGMDEPDPDRLPPIFALPIIASMSLALWVLIWKAGELLVSALG